MTSRLIREDMLDSERVQTLPFEGRWLFVAVILTADDLGLLELNSFKLSRKSGIDPAQLPALLQLMADADLIRVYSAGGKRYAFVPRFRQRMRLKRTKCPLPPEALMADDDDAINKINELQNKCLTDDCIAPTNAGECRPEPEPEPEEEKEEPSVLVERKASDAYRVPDCPYETLLAQYHETLPILPGITVFSDARKRPLHARWVEVCADARFDRQQGEAWFLSFWTIVARSDFLCGRKKAWKATFDWLLKPTNFAKVIEGNYVGERA